MSLLEFGALGALLAVRKVAGDGVAGEHGEADAAKSERVALIHLRERFTEQIGGVFVVADGVNVAVAVLEVVPGVELRARCVGGGGLSVHVRAFGGRDAAV